MSLQEEQESDWEAEEEEINPWDQRMQEMSRDRRLTFALSYGVAVLAIVLLGLISFRGLDRLFGPQKPQRLQSLGAPPTLATRG